MIIPALTVLFVLLTGILAGVLLAVDIAVVPMLGVLPGGRFVQVHRLLDPGFDPMMPRLSKIALAAGLVLAVRGGAPIADRVLSALAEMCLLGVALVSELGNVRINRRIASWDGADLPPAWQDVRTRWFRAHRLRTVLAITAFTAATTGTFAG